MRKVKKWAFWPFLEVLRLFRAHKGGQGPHKACASILGSEQGLMPETFVHRLLLTAGVGEQRFSLVLWLLLNAGIGDQHLDAVRSLLPTTCVCDQRLGTVHRLLPNAGVCDQRLDPVLDFCLPHVYATSF